MVQSGLFRRLVLIILTILQVVSGLTGAACFVLIHFTGKLPDPRKAAYLQLAANTFVFLSWGTAYFFREGWWQHLALAGAIIPVVMGSITTYRVFVRKTYQAESGQ